MTEKRVLSVGQCSYDHGSISRALQALAADIVSADSTEEALTKLREQPFALVLVNRIFDADSTSGIDFIRRLRRESTVPVMLVSNYADAQAQAVAAGALPGFGKELLGSKQEWHDVLMRIQTVFED